MREFAVTCLFLVGCSSAGASIEGNHQYSCPTHGDWCAGSSGVVFREEEPHAEWECCE